MTELADAIRPGATVPLASLLQGPGLAETAAGWPAVANGLSTLTNDQVEYPRIAPSSLARPEAWSSGC